MGGVGYGDGSVRGVGVRGFRLVSGWRKVFFLVDMVYVGV